MSSLCIRMRPYDANLPIQLWPVRSWMAYSPPERVRAPNPIGLFGAPPGSRRANLVIDRTSSGGDHAGRRCLPATSTWPNHCW